MSLNSLSQQKTLKKLNKMLDMADKTGSTSELVNINNESNLTTINSNSDGSIVYTPLKQSDVVLGDTKESAAENNHEAFFSSSGGKKLITVTKVLPTTPSSTASDSSSPNLKPPVRNRNRPQSMDGSSLVNDLNKNLNNISPPASPPRTSKIPLSPRKFNLMKEKNKRQSLDDVQDILSEQLEELRSIASKSDDSSNKLNFIQQPPNIIEKQGTGSTGASTDQFFSAVNSHDGSNEQHSIEKDDDVENYIVMRSSDLSIKKVVVSDILEHQGQPKTSSANYEDDDDEYEDLEDEEKEKTLAHERKTHNAKRNLKSKSNKNNFDVKTMETLLSNLDQVNDFDNLGMKNEEKKYLQLLVGNLSKLTADMILDPSKYEEGLRRLKKAALALEGF